MLEEMGSVTNSRVTIYVRLFDEGTDVYRPTTALVLGNGLFRIEATPGYSPKTEKWEFVPGSDVRAAIRRSESGDYSIAVKP